MKWSDILRQSLNNLFRRKLRSILTMLGVVIGTAAIVVTLSLGAGAEKTQMEALESSTNLKLIQVYPYYGSNTEQTSGMRVTKITDSTIRDIRRMSGVDAVTPLVYAYFGTDFVVETGKYQSYTSLLAVIPADFAKIQKLKSGTYFTGNTDRMEFIMSEVALMEFRIPNKETEWVDVYSILYDGGELPLPPISWYNARYSVSMRWYDYTDYETNNYEPIVYNKDYNAKLVGIIGADKDDWTFAYNAVVDLNWLKKLYKENRSLFKELGSTDALSKYDSVYVLADSVDSVEEVLRQLNEYGVQYSSPMQSVTALKAQIQTMQGFLGFIGAVSMLVAALSIANTMMMSIYERTREIGVMKVLGCKLSNIRMMFLSEAAFIGLFGGFLGLLFSFGLSYALNNVDWLRQMVSSIMSGASWYDTGGGSASIISPRLALGTWAFVVGVAVCSGLYPAHRAMSLSSLAAIRNAE